jgi:hypothetical protein
MSSIVVPGSAGMALRTASRARLRAGASIRKRFPDASEAVATPFCSRQRLSPSIVEISATFLRTPSSPSMNIATLFQMRPNNGLVCCVVNVPCRSSDGSSMFVMSASLNSAAGWCRQNLRARHGESPCRSQPGNRSEDYVRDMGVLTVRINFDLNHAAREVQSSLQPRRDRTP